ncbi:MAG TPA: hypothetical protein VIN03_27630 [Roseateles sp.]
MNDFDNDSTALDAALRERLHDGGEPDDAGFSLRVMGALPEYVAPEQRRWARWARRAQWLAISTAACAAAGLLATGNDALDAPRAAAAVALMGLLIFWSIPSRWSQG